MLSKKFKEEALKKLENFTGDELELLSKMYDKDYDMYQYFTVIFKMLHKNGNHLEDEHIKVLNEYVDNFGKVFNDIYLLPDETYSDEELKRIVQAFTTGFKPYILTISHIVYCHKYGDISFKEFEDSYYMTLEQLEDYVMLIKLDDEL